ncbi:MAG: glycosyltransferase [Nitrospiraceae bacterium]
MSEQHDQETISIILCSMDRHADLEQAVASVRRSGPIGSTAEIVVVEEADEPKPVDGTRYVHLPRAGRGFGYARNVGVKTATGELLLFLDDDCRAERGWAEALIQPFAADGDVLGVAGSVAVQGCGPVGYAENILGFPGGGLRYLHESGGQVVPTRHLSTCNCAYRRRALEQVGGFPEEAQAGSEDALAAERVARLGSCRYQPNAVVYHRTRIASTEYCAGSCDGVSVKWLRWRGASSGDASRRTCCAALGPSGPWDSSCSAASCLPHSWRYRSLSPSITARCCGDSGSLVDILASVRLVVGAGGEIHNGYRERVGTMALRPVERAGMSSGRVLYVSITGTSSAAARSASCR